MQTSNKGIDLITKFEGLKLAAYYCPSKKITIGYGHTGLVDGVMPYIGMSISKDKAIELLKSDLIRYENDINKMLKITVKQCQFDALVSLAFNIGINAFKESTVLSVVNKKMPSGEVVRAFLMWNKININGKMQVSTGLSNRRKEESQLYCSNY